MGEYGTQLTNFNEAYSKFIVTRSHWRKMHDIRIARHPIKQIHFEIRKKHIEKLIGVELSDSLARQILGVRR
jgi:hypothetical protein